MYRKCHLNNILYNFAVDTLKLSGSAINIDHTYRRINIRNRSRRPYCLQEAKKLKLEVWCSWMYLILLKLFSV